MKQRTIYSVLGNKQALTLLRYFALNPNTELSYTRLRSKVKLAKATLTKWLSTLTEQEIILVKNIGTTKLYRADKDNPFLKQFKILTTIGQLQFFKKIAQKLNVEIHIFGSAARGEDHETSDVDILVIGKVNKEDLLRLIEKEKTGRKIQLQIFAPLEWSILAKKDKAFYERVEKDKIALQ